MPLRLYAPPVCRAVDTWNKNCSRRIQYLEYSQLLQVKARPAKYRSDARKNNQNSIPAAIARERLSLQRHFSEKCFTQRPSNQTSYAPPHAKQTICHHGIHVAQSTTLASLTSLAHNRWPNSCPASCECAIDDGVYVYLC